MSTHEHAEARFAICIRNNEHPASLELRKLYEVIPDPDAAPLGQVRIIDESGEDYLYPAADFLFVDLPHAVKVALLKAS
jgi:hypothetical protein